MYHHQFDSIIANTLDAAHNMLTRKSEGYSNESDRLHNFRTGAALNGISMEQVCWGMATKHIISIRDMVMSGESYSAEIWDEKLGDAINYLAILKAITVETNDDKNVESTESLAKLRENLVGDIPSTYVPREAYEGLATTNKFPERVESDARDQMKRDLESIKRVADKNKNL